MKLNQAEIKKFRDYCRHMERVTQEVLRINQNDEFIISHYEEQKKAYKIVGNILDNENRRDRR